MEYLTLTFLRLIVPLLILRFPLLGILLASYLDYRDWDFLGVTTDSEMYFYQNWDKILDTYYLAIAWFVSLSWKDKTAKMTASILFFYRFIGVALALISDRGILLFFPNIFEWFFIFYLFFIRITKKSVLFSSKKILFIVLVSLTIPKLAQELCMHVIRKAPWDLFDIAQKTGINKWLPDYIDASFWIWVAIFLTLPLGALYWCIRNASDTKKQKR